MRRSFALVAVLLVVCLTPGAMAQTSCQAPTIVQVGGSNPSCAGDAVTLDAGAGWASYQWSNGATTRMITDSPTTASSYTVTVMDANGCSVTSTPLAIDVKVRHVPQINSSFGPSCPGGQPFIYAWQPDPNFSGWTSYDWSVTNGSIIGPSNVFNPQFVAGQSGTMSVTLHVTEGDGCPSTATFDLPIRTPQPPPISAPAYVCPGVRSSAQIDSSCCNNDLWTIQGGTMEPDGYMGGPHSSRVYFTADGSGPVILTFQGNDTHGCAVTSHLTIPLGAPAPPVIQVFSPICTTAQDLASVAPGGTWAAYAWSITNGVIESGANADHMSFHGDGSGRPIGLTLDAVDANGCSARATATVAVKTLTPDLRVQFSPSTATATNSALVQLPPGANYSSYQFQWSIQNGTFDFPPSGSYVYFHSNGSGPTTVTVSVTDANSCAGSASVEIPLAAIPTPRIGAYYPKSCPGVNNIAFIASPSGGWSTINWSITNGTLTSQNGQTSINFTTNGSAAATLSVVVTDSTGAQTGDSVTLPLVEGGPPISVPWTTSCAGGYGYASIDSQYGTFNSYQWSVTHARLDSWPSDNHATFIADGSGPVTVTVALVDHGGCPMSSSVVLPLKTIATPTMTVSDPMPASSGFARIEDPDHIFTNFNWSATHATIGAYGPDLHNVTIYPDGSGPVTLTCELTTNEGCKVTATREVLLQGYALMIDAAPTVCGPVTRSASLFPTTGFSNIQWSITNGAILSGGNGNTVSFHANGGGDTTLIASAVDTAGQVITATKVIRYVPMTATISGSPYYCPQYYSQFWVFGSTPIVSLAVAQSQNATVIITQPDHFSAKVIDATQPMSVTVTATTADGCQTNASVTQPSMDSIYLPDIALDHPALCPGAQGHASVRNVQPNTSYHWQIVNGVLDSYDYAPSVTFHATGAAPVQLSNYALPPFSTTCYSTKSVTIPVDSPSASITQSGTLCPNGTVTLTASGGTSYQWSNGATTQSITVSQAGTYGVTATNANGCTASASANVAAVTAPVASISASGPTTFCAGGSVTLTASAGASYLWSNGATTQSMTVSATGNYTVTVTDVNGCTAAASQSVTVNAPPSPQIVFYNHYDANRPAIESLPAASDSSTYDYCGSVDASFIVIPGNYSSYLWSTGATTPSIHVTSAGVYTVTVTDANGCSGSSSITVNVKPIPPVPTITASGSTTLCPNGSVTLTSSAASSYLWSNGATTQSIVVSQAGTYSVSTSVNGCTSTSQPVSVTQNSVVNITASGPTTSCSGSLTLTASSGTSYLWSNGETTQSITVSRSGNYSVTVTLPEGCSLTSAPVAVNLGPAVSIAADQTSFCGISPIHFTSSVIGGIAPYSYQWHVPYSPEVSGSDSSLTFTAANSGYAYLVITDANGCSATSNYVTFSVRNPPAVQFTYNAPVCGSEMSAREVTPTDAASYQWSITNGTITQAQGHRVLFNATASPVTLTVTVTDANGCSTTASQTITMNQPVTPTITASGPTTFCAGGSVTLTASSGANYFWSNGATTQSIIVSTAGSYTVRVSDANFCGATSSPAIVSVNASPATPSVTASGPTTFCAGGSVTLTAPAGYSYLWSNGATTQSINVTASGSYGVTVTNASGCSAQSAVTSVTANAQPATPVITASGPTTFCAGGSVTLTAPGGNSYLWSNGATTQSINVTNGGSYSVTVTNASGCSAQSAVTIVTVNANPATPVITASGPTTFCAGGSVNLSAPGGYSYLWSNGATTQSINVTNGGAYSVTVTNASGCSAQSTVTSVTVNANPATPVITASGPTTFCSGGSVNLTAPGGYSYLWSTGATTQSINVTTSGSYSVTVTNANGCSAQSTVTSVTVNAKPATPVITASGPTTFCAGGSVTLTAPAGYSYLWSNGATTQSINVTSTGTFSVTVTNASGCSAQSGSTSVTVNANPATPVVTAGGSTNICPGSSVTLSAPAGFSYRWSNGATTQSISATAAGNYAVTVTNAGGCSATSSATAVTLKTSTAITQPSNLTIARNVTGTLSVSATGTNLRYQWYQGAAGSTTTPLGTLSTQSVGPYKQKGNYQFWVRVTGDCGVVSSNTVTVTVN